VNHADGGQHLTVRVVLGEVFSQGNDGADMILGKHGP
jgi:hypothetical protein